MSRRRFAVFLCALFTFTSANQALAADPSLIHSVFTQLIPSKDLANPSAIVLDEATGEIVYQNNAYAGRKPASVIKLLAAAAAYTYLDLNETFTTSVWTGTDSKSVVIQGTLDPWIAFDSKVADKMGRTAMPRLEYYALKTLKNANNNSTHNTVIYFSNFHAQEIASLRAYLKKQKAHTTIKWLSTEAAIAKSQTQVFASASPNLQAILDWTLTWSDNELAERIARFAAAAAGKSADDAGVAATFSELLTHLGVSTTNLVVKDASGLSKENRVTAYQVAQLLMVIKHDPKYARLISGLPVGGITGTLRKRFIETAPNAIGLVKAKTGTLNGTANLAGYVESGNHEYIFVIIADQLPKNYTAEKRARAMVDKILGKIASPLMPVLNPITETATP